MASLPVISRAKPIRHAPPIKHNLHSHVSQNSHHHNTFQQVSQPPQYYYPQLVLVPYGTAYGYHQGVTYYQPVTYPQFQPQQYIAPVFSPMPQQFMGYSAPDPSLPYVEDSLQYSDVGLKGMKNFRGKNEKNHYLSEKHDGRLLLANMGVSELQESIKETLEVNSSVRVSWLNRMLSKCNTREEFDQALETYKLYQSKIDEATAETGTLLLKAACRAGIPEVALDLLRDSSDVTVYPTLGGIHYLMINFSLKKDTKAVVETYEVTRKRDLKPTQRTFHILIRECVDHDFIDYAMKYAEECKTLEIVPNRVTYNILMNGCRKFLRANDILELRKQMNDYRIEINDTTVKFTVLAHMMLKNTKAAVTEFMKYPEIEVKLEDFCNKFFEVTEESHEQKRLVVDLFNALKSNKLELPAEAEHKLANLKTELGEN